MKLNRPKIVAIYLGVTFLSAIFAGSDARQAAEYAFFFLWITATAHAALHYGIIIYNKVTLGIPDPTPEDSAVNEYFLIAPAFFVMAAFADEHFGLALLVLFGIGGSYLYANFGPVADNTPDVADLRATLKSETPMSSEQFIEKVSEIVPLDPALSELVSAMYQLENLAEPPKEPTVKTDIEIARYKDKLAHYINNANNTDLAPTVAEIVKPFALSTEKGIFVAEAPLAIEKVENLAQRLKHPTYFGVLHRVLLANQEKAKTVHDYLDGTPFDWLENRAIAVNLTNRFSHTHIMGTTGAGKTQLIQYLISRDLEEDCCVIVIDNQRQMIPKLANIKADTQYISPHDPLELNLFDMPHGNNTASLLRFVLSGIMNAPLTAMQNNIFQFAVELVVANRGNIVMFQQILEGKLPDLSKVDEFVRNFFEGEYRTNKEYARRSQEIAWRITSLLSNPVLRKIFLAEKNKCKIDFSKDMVLIDTDIDLLQDATGMFGRFFISQILQEARSRFKGHHRPVYLYVDEFYYYLDESLTSMLETARKAKIGVTLANQYLKQIDNPKMASAVMALTNTKFASHLDVNDLSQMAKAMRVSPEYLQNIKSGHFALYQNGQETVDIEVQFGYVEQVVGNEPEPPKVQQDQSMVNKKEAIYRRQSAIIRELPERLHEIYSSEKSTEFNKEIKKRFNISDDSWSDFLDITSDAILGITPIGELSERLQNELGMDAQTASELEYETVEYNRPIILHTQPDRQDPSKTKSANPNIVEEEEEW